MNWQPPPPPYSVAQPPGQPGQPQAPQQPAAPAQPAYAPPGGLPVPQPMPGQQAPAPAVPGQSHMPNAAAMAAYYQRTQEVANRGSGGGGAKKQFLKLDGPNGSKFSQAPVNYSARRLFYICGGWDPTKPNFGERTTRKYQSNGRWTTLYAGEGSIIHQSLKMLWDMGQKPEWLKPRRELVVQGFPCDFEQGGVPLLHECTNEQGLIVPNLYAMSQKQFDKLMAEVRLVGTMAGAGGTDEEQFTVGYGLCFHEDNGRPFLISRTKTGPQDINVDYDIRAQNPGPMPQEFRSGLSNMYQLDTLFTPSSDEKQVQALIAVGYPIPPTAQHLVPQGGMPAPAQGYPPMQGQHMPPPQQAAYAPPAQSYQPQAAPPVPNPYQQQPQYAPPQAPVAPQQPPAMPPGMPQPPGGYAQPQAPVMQPGYAPPAPPQAPQPPPEMPAAPPLPAPQAAPQHLPPPVPPPAAAPPSVPGAPLPPPVPGAVPPPSPAPAPEGQGPQSVEALQAQQTGNGGGAPF